MQRVRWRQMQPNNVEVSKRLRCSHVLESKNLLRHDLDSTKNRQFIDYFNFHFGIPSPPKKQAAGRRRCLCDSCFIPVRKIRPFSARPTFPLPHGASERPGRATSVPFQLHRSVDSLFSECNYFNKSPAAMHTLEGSAMWCLILPQ